jgi:hypothetical protein
MSAVHLVWLDVACVERFHQQQLLTEKLGRFWRRGEDEVRPRDMSGEDLVE